MRTRCFWFDAVLFLLFTYLFIMQVYSIWPFTIDDMYIPLRYARHWVFGQGLLWNSNEAPVEGYTNFSFLLLAAGSILLHLNSIIVLKVAGVVGLFFTFVAVYCISRFWFDKRVAFIPALTLLVYKGQIIWSASGLETTVFQALICSSVYFLFKGMGFVAHPGESQPSQPKFFIVAGILLSLAGLTRPEAPAFMAMYFILLSLEGLARKDKRYWIGILSYTITLMVLYGPYFIWRWHYFGLLFPNSVYCKGLYSASTAVLDLNYLQLIWPFALVAIPACIGSLDKRHYFLWLPSLFYCVTLFHADPVVAFDNRLFLTSFALFLPLSFQGFSRILFYLLQSKDAYYDSALYWGWFLLCLLFLPWMTLSEYAYFTKNPLKGEHLRASVAKWLQLHLYKEDQIVLGDCGMIPYLTDFRFIDSYCLNNSTMAQYPKAHRYEQFCREIIKKNPRVIILTSLMVQGKATYAPSDACLKSVLGDLKNYRLIRTFSTGSSVSSYRYELFLNIGAMQDNIV